MKHLKQILLSVVLAASPLTQAEISAEATIQLTDAVSTRSEEARARDAARHPVETLSFFGVEPGMTVAEALPGGGWYTQVLANYLGAESTLYGVNYVERMWPLYGFLNAEQIAKRIASTEKFTGMVDEFTDSGLAAKGFTFNSASPELASTVDRFLMIRALHNLNRFEEQAGTRSQALASVRALLKDDGLVGVVQHRIPESAAAEGADGSRGYLKQSDVVAMFEAAGFELVASSEINANANDKPDPEDIVWRLPPSYSGTRDDPEAKAAVDAIGESDRMTLLFRKSS